MIHFRNFVSEIKLLCSFIHKQLMQVHVSEKFDALEQIPAYTAIKVGFNPVLTQRYVHAIRH